MRHATRPVKTFLIGLVYESRLGDADAAAAAALDAALDGSRI